MIDTADTREVLSTKNRSNLGSRSRIGSPCQLRSLGQWYRHELAIVVGASERRLLKLVHEHLSDFVVMPDKALLLWEGCDRSQKYHRYPESIRERARGSRLDGRVNGPAIAAFMIAGGRRPDRAGSNNKWSIHHIYSGKFPYPGRESTTHAARDGKHCTQSAGLVAVHPIADQMCDEYPWFAWLLRARAYNRFGYDPDGVFSRRPHDACGFVPPRKCEVIERA